MAVTIEQLRSALDAIEPNYVELARLGADAFPHLAVLATDPDPLLASKAVYLASLIRHPDAAAVVREGARSDRPQVRIAAAAAAGNLPAAQAGTLLAGLLGDQDLGVRKTALKSVPADAPADLRSRVQELTRSDPEAGIRQLSTDALRRIRPET